MGYMGFGMRKEVYTRKPKTAFKKIKQLYDQEFKKSGKDYSYKNCDAETLERIRQKIKRQKNKLVYIQLSVFIGLTICLGYVTWEFFNSQHYTPKVVTEDKEPYFKTIIYKLDDKRTLKVEYFKFGPKSAETNLKNGLKHQNSESYYESGEQFRSAAYFYDTLVVEVYFYKNGDTIKNFPAITDDKVYHLTLPLPDSEKTATFNFYDGKILQDSYYEISQKNN